MEYEQLPDEAANFIEGLRVRNAVRQAERESTPGFHESGLLWDIQQTSGLTSGKTRLEEDPTLRFELGYAWEDMLGEHLFSSDEIIKPGTLTKDGILVTPDNFDQELWEPHEYKGTWTSMNRPVRDRWYWLHQMKAEAYITEAKTTKLMVLYLCGDWKPPRPIPMFYRFFWKDWELEQTWAMLRKHRDWLVSKGLDRI